MAAYLSLVGFQIIGVNPEDVYFRSACDKDKHALQALKTLHPKCRPEHINEDINDLLTEEAKTKLGVFEASINKALAEKLADIGITFANKKEAKQLPPEAKEIVKEHGTAMLDGYMKVFAEMENPFINTPSLLPGSSRWLHAHTDHGHRMHRLFDRWCDPAAGWADKQDICHLSRVHATVASSCYLPRMHSHS